MRVPGVRDDSRGTPRAAADLTGRLPSQRIRAMDELIDRSLRGPLSKADRQRLDEWRRTSPENERRYRETRALLEGARSVGIQHRDRAGAPPVDEILARAGVDSSAVSPSATDSRTWSRVAPWAIAAAALLILAVQSVLLHPTQVVESRSVQVVTGPGEMTTIEMEDGSVIRLAPSSQVRFSEGSGDRAVHLDGKAFFSVAPDETRPFQVVTPQARAVVLGTRFEVAGEGEQVRLLVVEGRVAFEGSRGRVEVGAGEISVASNQEVSQPRPMSEEDAMPDWTGRFLAFRETPLREAFNEIARSYGVRVELTIPALGERTVTASFTGQEIGHIVDVLCTIASTDCTLDDGTITISEP